MHASLASPHNDTMRHQAEQALRQASLTGSPYALVDFPNHGNVGDSAIWVGEVRLLQEIYGHAPAYVSVFSKTADELRGVLPKGTVFLHGGGNFGDIWPAHQLYREQILQACPHLRVVQLPQSIHFSDPAAIERTRRAIAGHPDFHMMVRDRESLDFVNQHFGCSVELVPDCAFGIDSRRFQGHVQGQGIRALFRTDHEARPDAKAGHQLFADIPVEDWEGLWTPPSAAALRADWLWRKAERLPPKSLWMQQRFQRLNQQAEHRVQLGLAQLARAEVVVTDRLHGHILSCLLGRPHVVIDNFYGKIRHYIGAWSMVPFCRVAADYAEARQQADDLLAESRQGVRASA